MNKSFYGKEDTELSSKLDKELSGIFNWAMEGLRRRISRGGYFIQPTSGKEYLELMSEIGNPIGSFIDDALVVDPMGSVAKDDVFTCYKRWALHRSLPPGTELAFKRRFLAAIQEHAVTSDLLREKGERVHIYVGIKLSEKAMKYVESIESFDNGAF